jgi:hypothetical protein
MSNLLLCRCLHEVVLAGREVGSGCPGLSFLPVLAEVEPFICSLFQVEPSNSCEHLSQLSQELGLSWTELSQVELSSSCEQLRQELGAVPGRAEPEPASQEGPGGAAARTVQARARRYCGRGIASYGSAILPTTISRSCLA